MSGGGVMASVQVIGGWLRLVVRRTPELFEFTSGITTLALVLIAWIKHGDRFIPSIALIAEVLPESMWFCLIGTAAVLQLVALWLDDPGDGRHPVAKRNTWVRFGAAVIVAAWYLILCFAIGAQIGLNHVQAPYSAFCGMNLYIMAHVALRSRA